MRLIYLTITEARPAVNHWGGMSWGCLDQFYMYILHSHTSFFTSCDTNNIASQPEFTTYDASLRLTRVVEVGVLFISN